MAFVAGSIPFESLYFGYTPSTLECGYTRSPDRNHDSSNGTQQADSSSLSGPSPDAQQDFSLNLPNKTKRLHLTEPMGYLDFLALQMHAALLLTDSGGIQEETTFLGIPCLTARPNTERPLTINHGTNRLVASRCEAIMGAAEEKCCGHREIASPRQSFGMA